MAFRSSYIWFNGKFVPWDDAKVHVGVHALHYGTSVFEGIRAYATPQGPAIFRLQPHVQRMVNSAKVLRMPLPISAEELAQACIDTVAKNGHDACYIRPLAFRGYERLGVDGRACPVDVVVMTWEWGAYLGPEALEQGVDACVTSWRRMAPGTLAANAKIGGQYVNSQFVTMEAKDLGYTEGIALDINGYVSEGSGENIFLVFGDRIVTPSLSSSILDGITRDSVITLARSMGYTVEETLVPRERMYVADEMFFTGTAAEITPVRSVDRIPIGAGKRGPVTARLQEAFLGITAGKLEDRWGWLTPVRPRVKLR
jgi:branched-chain amino acid aminotransferase